MCRYNEMTDEALIERLRAGESAIADYLMEKYKGLVRKKARPARQGVVFSVFCKYMY